MVICWISPVTSSPLSNSSKAHAAELELYNTQHRTLLPPLETEDSFKFMFQWHELVLITFEIRISLLYLHVHKQCNPIPCLSYTQKLFPNNYACIETMQNRCSTKKIIFPRLLCPTISIETINDAWFFWFHGRFFSFVLVSLRW